MYRYALFFLIFSRATSPLSAQEKTPYVPCNETPEIMQNYYADVRALDRVYIVEGSPEKRERYKTLAAE